MRTGCHCSMCGGEMLVGLRGGPVSQGTEHGHRALLEGSRRLWAQSSPPGSLPPSLDLCLSAVFPGRLSSQNYLFGREALYCAELYSGPSV